MRKDILYDKMHLWRLKYISPRNFVLLISLITGMLGGAAGILLKNVVHFIQKVLVGVHKFSGVEYLYIALPFIGILLTYLMVKYLVRDDIGHGITKVLQAISRKNSIIKLHNTYSSFIASSITVGFGGSVGLEAPIVMTGSAIGSNLGQYFKVDYKTTTLLIGCGAAGAIAGIFKAPIAGVIFALEVLMLDLTMSSLIPLLISSASGALLAYFFMGSDVLFSFEVSRHPFNIQNVPYYILLGLFCGAISIYFTRANMSLEKKFGEIKRGSVRVFAGGVITCLLIFLFPPLLGEGYSVLNGLLKGDGIHLLENSIFSFMGNNSFLLLVYLFLILIFKVVAMSATTGGGGVGGVFAPSLFMGGVLGYFFSKLINFFIDGRLPESNFVLAGMAGVMSGVMLAPLTAIFLIAEITGGYQFFVPLMITSVVAYLATKPFEPHSIYTKHLAQKGDLITHNKDQAVLKRLLVDDLIETNFISTSPNITLGEFTKLVAKSQRNVFPVINEDNTFLGVVFINDIRHILFDTEQYDKVYIRNLMFMPDTWIEEGADMESVAQKFAETSHYNLPVLNKGKYVGFVSRANVFSAYRNLVKDFSTE